ncbi:hypothetical protein TNIN_237201 [Trichonephila inaurata madagascariensis]|uniref:Uncharacterized protein n=1 Tax=Trichonephila inaurata madagascariensis TaxID=2747483 RepID=A0A8X6X792_9ARAC|nr:hypothetical protein TNIN_237201 [Trichonephila inaurata madagascariensis]
MSEKQGHVSRCSSNLLDTIKGGSAEFTVLLKEKVCGGTRSHIPEVPFQFPEQNSIPINWKSTLLAEKSIAPSVIVLCHRYLPT